jgi:hypothetical protein
MSVISAENVRISRCLFKNTHGSAPGAGIDLEPNSSKDRLANVVVSECVSDNNKGPGIVVALRHLSSESKDVSILFTDCHVKSGRTSGITIGAVMDKGPKGLIEFRNCTVQNTDGTGVYIANKSANSVRLRFANCEWQNVAARATYPKAMTSVPICFVLRDKNFPAIFGGIEFVNCHVYDRNNRPFLAVADEGKDSLIRDVKGQICVDNPYGARMDWGKRKPSSFLKINPP